MPVIVQLLRPTIPDFSRTAALRRSATSNTTIESVLVALLLSEVPTNAAAFDGSESWYTDADMFSVIVDCRGMRCGGDAG